MRMQNFIFLALRLNSDDMTYTNLYKQVYIAHTEYGTRNRSPGCNLQPPCPCLIFTATVHPLPQFPMIVHPSYLNPVLMPNFKHLQELRLCLLGWFLRPSGLLSQE